MAYEKYLSARDRFAKFIHQFQPETKTLIRKLERILIKLYRQNLSLLSNQTYLNIYIYIYIFTNLLSTSIHGYQEKRKKTRQEQEIKISRITDWEKKKKYHRTKKKEKANSVTPVEKNQEICSQLVKRKIKPTVNAAMLQLQECSTRVEPITKLT